MRIADVSIQRPVFAVMVIGALVTLGWISVGRLGVDLFPRVEFPYVAVTTVLEGATPETVETEITDIVEEHINTIAGVKRLQSTSSEGLSQVFVEFELEENLDVKAQDVRDKVALARFELPEDAEPSVVEKLDPDAYPILSVIVAGDMPVRELTRIADRIVKERLQRIPGVGSIRLVGNRDREVRLWLDGHRLRSYALTADDVIRAVRAEHAEVPGGRLETPGQLTEFTVKTKGEVETVDEFGDLVVAYREGRPTRVRDVARVEDGLEDERTYAELDGVPGVSLELRRQSGRNTVEVARAVKTAVVELAAELPPGVRLIVTRDLSRFIESSAHDVGVDMILGGILAVLVTLAFLRSLRTTVIVSIAIPTSIVATFFLLYVMSFTLNLLTLLALSVAIGILVDDAIVVLESIHRHIDAGEAPMRAAAEGTAEVGTAVFAGTLAVLAVFVPIAFMQGVVGRFFYEYGLTIVFAVSVSLLVAVTLTPMLCARWLRSVTSHGRLYARLEDGYQQMEARYHTLLAVALRRRGLVIALALVAIVGGLVLAERVPLAFTSRVDRSEFEAVLELPLGNGIGETTRVARRVAAALREMEHIETVFLTIGADSRNRVNEASYHVVTSPKRQRSVGELTLMERARVVMRGAAPEAKTISVTRVPWVSGVAGAEDLEYVVQGPDLAALEQLSEDIAAGMRAHEAFVDVTSSWEAGKPELQVLVDRRRAADLGVPIRGLAATVRALVGGLDVATYEEDGERFDVRVRLEEGQRDDLSVLRLIQVHAAGGRLADLTNVARLHVAAAPAQIDRQDRARMVALGANTPPGVALGTAAHALDRIVAGVGLPPGYRGTHEGRARRMKESTADVVFALGLALIALYMILASQFNSFVQPGVIMLTAPLAFIGAFAGLWLTGTTMSIFTQIGLLALMGLVMKNGVLLVDYANQQRAAGCSSGDAMLRAGAVRLRPVLMTAFSTIFGMIPVALSQSDGAEWRNPMGIIIIGGLLSSTVLTLFVVPVVYVVAEDLRVIPARIVAFFMTTRASKPQSEAERVP